MPYDSNAPDEETDEQAVMRLCKVIHETWVKGKKEGADGYTIEDGNYTAEYIYDILQNKHANGRYVKLPGCLTYASVDAMTEVMEHCCGNCEYFEEHKPGSMGGKCRKYTDPDLRRPMIMYPYSGHRETICFTEMGGPDVNIKAMKMCTGYKDRADGIKRYSTRDT